MPERPAIHPGWDAEMRSLIGRFHDAGPAKEGFDLTDHSTVVDPVLYHKAIALEIAQGPEKPRAKSGSLKSQIQSYLDVRAKLKL